MILLLVMKPHDHLENATANLNCVCVYVWCVGVLGAKQLYIALKGDQNGAGVKFQSNALGGKFHFCDFISSAAALSSRHPR